jgi:hypothetical protein
MQPYFLSVVHSDRNDWIIRFRTLVLSPRLHSFGGSSFSWCVRWSKLLFCCAENAQIPAYGAVWILERSVAATVEHAATEIGNVRNSRACIYPKYTNLVVCSIPTSSFFFDLFWRTCLSPPFFVLGPAWISYWMALAA